MNFIFSEEFNLLILFLSVVVLEIGRKHKKKGKEN